MGFLFKFVLFLIGNHVFRSPTAGFHFNSFLRCPERCYRFALIAVEGKLIIAGEYFSISTQLCRHQLCFCFDLQLNGETSRLTCFASSFYNCEGIFVKVFLERWWNGSALAPIWSHRSLNCFAFHCVIVIAFTFDANCKPHNRSMRSLFAFSTFRR